MVGFTDATSHNKQIGAEESLQGLVVALQSLSPRLKVKILPLLSAEFGFGLRIVAVKLKVTQFRVRYQHTVKEQS